MFALLTKVTKMHIPIDITIDLFDKLVLPILLYGCEVWGCDNCDQIEVVYNKFLKRILKINKYTPNCMVYGEAGKSPLKSIINSRMITFWNRLKVGKDTKYSFILLNVTEKFNDDDSNAFKSGWLIKIRDILNLSGLGFIWLENTEIDTKSLKQIIELHNADTYKQTWCSDVFNNSCCLNYRIFKTELVFEKYLIQLSLVIE